MDFPNIFTQPVADDVIKRINQLQPGTAPAWGKMNVSQMLAHVNVQYELAYEPEKHPKPGFLMRLMLKAFAKKVVTGTAPYKRNSPTAPAFLIKDERNFEQEKARLIAYIRQTVKQGEQHFEGKVSPSFGPLSKNEWNTLFYKHLDHHLTQFAV